MIGSATFQFADLIEIEESTPNPDIWLFCAWVKLSAITVTASLAVNGDIVATAEHNTNWQFLVAEINIIDCAGAEFSLVVDVPAEGWANFDDVWMVPKDLTLRNTVPVWPEVENYANPPVCDGGLLVW